MFTAEARATIDRSAYETIATIERLNAWIAGAREAGVVAFDTETTSLDALQAELVGFSLALAPGKAALGVIVDMGIYVTNQHVEAYAPRVAVEIRNAGRDGTPAGIVLWHSGHR